MNKKLHILFLCGWYPSKVLPKNGDFIQRHAEAVQKECEVSVLHIITNPETRKVQIDTFKDDQLSTYIAYLPQSVNKITKIFQFWSAYRKLLKIIGEFDCVHLNRLYPFGLFALHLKFFKRKKYIISEHWTGYHSPNQKISATEIFLSKMIVKNAAFVCPVSNHLKESMLKLGLKGNYKIVPNVVNTDIFKIYEKKPSTFTLTHISSMLDKHKNISGMLRVAKMLEEKEVSFTWNFIGGSEDLFKDQIETLNFTSNSINFIDHIPHSEVPNYLMNSHVFVLFSNYENLPCVILEAFSCGLPVISTDVGGIREFFPNGFGFLIDKGNEIALLDKIQEVYQKSIPFEHKELHDYAVQNFGVQKICNSFTQLYIKALT